MDRRTFVKAIAAGVVSPCVLEGCVDHSVLKAQVDTKYVIDLAAEQRDVVVTFPSSATPGDSFKVELISDCVVGDKKCAVRFRQPEDVFHGGGQSAWFVFAEGEWLGDL